MTGSFTDTRYVYLDSMVAYAREKLLKKGIHYTTVVAFGHQLFILWSIIDRLSIPHVLSVSYIALCEATLDIYFSHHMNQGTIFTDDGGRILSKQSSRLCVAPVLLGSVTHCSHGKSSKKRKEENDVISR